MLDVLPTPPHSLELEYAVIGAAMTYPDQLPYLMAEIGTNTDIFYRESNAKIWRGIVRIYESGGHPDPVILTETLKSMDELDEIGGSEAITACCSAEFFKPQIPQYVANLRQKMVLRKIARFGSQAAGEAYNPDADPSAIIGKFQHNLAVLDGDLGGVVNVDKDLGDTVDEVMAEYDRSGGDDFRVGFPTIDNAMGGFRRGEVLLVTGRPGAGKTWLLLNMLQHMIRNYKVMIVSGELKGRELMAKLVCSYSKLGYDKYRNKTFTDEELARFLAGLGEVRDLDIDIVPFSGESNTIASIAARAHQTKPDVIEMDGIYLFAPRLANKQEGWQYYTSISREIKTIAMQSDCVVMATHQLNKDESKKGLGRLAYADAFAQDASMVLAIEDEKLHTGSRVAMYKARDADSNRPFELVCDFSKSLVREEIVNPGVSFDDFKDVF